MPDPDMKPDWLRAIVRELRYTNFLLFALLALAAIAFMVTLWPK